MRAQPCAGAVKVEYATDCLGAGDWIWTTPSAVVRIELEVLDDTGAVIVSREVVVTNAVGSAWFDGLAPDRSYRIRGWAIDERGVSGPPVEAWTYSGVPPLAEPVFQDAAEVRFAADGRHVLTRSFADAAAPAMMLVDLETGDGTVVWTIVGPSGYPIRASGSDAMAFVDAGRLHVLQHAGLMVTSHEQWEWPHGGAIDPRSPFRLQEGVADVVLSQSDGSLTWESHDLATGVWEEHRSLPEMGFLQGPVVSPDEALVAYAYSEPPEDGQHELTVDTWLVVARASDLTEVLRVSTKLDEQFPGGATMLRWAPDSRRLALAANFAETTYLSNAGQVWILDVETETWRQVTGFLSQLESAPVRGLDWSPTGDQLIVSTGSLEATTYLISLDQPHPLAVPGSEESEHCL